MFKHFLMGFVMLALAKLVWAEGADFTGTWVLDIESSAKATGWFSQRPSESTDVITQDAGSMTFRITRDGRTTETTITVDGKPAPLTLKKTGQVVSRTTVWEGATLRSKLVDADNVLVSDVRRSLSADGKTMTVVMTSGPKRPHEEPRPVILIYRRR